MIQRDPETIERSVWRELMSDARFDLRTLHECKLFVDMACKLIRSREQEIAVDHEGKPAHFVDPRPTGRYGIDQGQFLAACGGGNAAFGERNSGGTPE